VEGREYADCKRYCQLHVYETEQRAWLSLEVPWQRPAYLLRQFTSALFLGEFPNREWSKCYSTSQDRIEKLAL